MVMVLKKAPENSKKKGIYKLVAFKKQYCGNLRKRIPNFWFSVPFLSYFMSF